MTILESFYILFKSDASDVKKGAEEAERSTKKLNESLKTVDTSSQKVGKSFLELARAAAGFISVGLAAHVVLRGLSEANEYALKLGDASRALGVNAEELDAWGNAVKRTGGTVEGFQNSLKGLADHFGTSASIALKTLPQLADVFSKLSRFRALQYGKILGLDEATILLLQQGRREVEAVIQRQRELGVVSQQNIEDSRKFRIAQNELDTSFRGLYLTLSTTLIPIFTRFYNFLVPIIQYITLHKDAVIGAFIGIGIAAGLMLLPFIIANATIIAIGAAVVGLIALFAIAYEDIKAFLEGNNSLTGDVLKKWPLIGGTIRGVANELHLLKKQLEFVLKLFSLLGDFVGKIFGTAKELKVVLQGQSLIDLMGNSPIASQSSNSIFSSSAFQRNQTINTGPISIQTQEDSAPAIGSALGKGLKEHLWQANNQFADGVQY